MKKILMYYTGEEDFWGRKFLKSSNNTFQEVDGVPHYTTEEGELLYTVQHFKIIKCPADDITKHLKTVFVVFENSQYNYYTSVNGQLDNSEIVSYFKGTYFNVGIYPKEIMEQCVNAKIVQEN